MEIQQTLENTYHQQNRTPKHDAYLDALRGLAILGVFFVHAFPSTERSGLVFPIWLSTLTWYGQYGVQLFFLVSAFTLLLSFHNRTRTECSPLPNYFIRRFFRIAPMFWSGVIFYTIVFRHIPNVWTPNGIGPKEIIATLTFTHGWYPTFISSVVPGGWSIAVESNFYLVFPLMAARISTIRQALWAFVIALISVLFFDLYLFHRMSSSWLGHRAVILNGFLGYFLPTQIPVFLLGFVAYYCVKSSKLLEDRSMRMARLSVFSAIGIVAAIIAATYHHIASLEYFPFRLLLTSGYGIAFALLVIGLSQVPYRLFVNRFLRYLGVISFSAYLDHFILVKATDRLLGAVTHHFHWLMSPVLYYAAFFMVFLGVTAGVATLTYLYIEVPFIALGKRIIMNRENLSPVLAAS